MKDENVSLHIWNVVTNPRVLLKKKKKKGSEAPKKLLECQLMRLVGKVSS